MRRKGEAVEFSNVSEIASKQMLLVTTPNVEGWRISRVFGLVTGEAVIAGGPIRDKAVAIENFFGGQVSAVTKLASEARELAALSIRQQAHAFGANAIVGCDLDYETVAGFVLVSISGTAVRIESEQGSYEPALPDADGEMAEVRCEKCGLMIPRLEPVCANCAAPRPKAG